MRFLVGLLIFWGCGQWLSAQSDTLVGVLKDVRPEGDQTLSGDVGQCESQNGENEWEGNVYVPRSEPARYAVRDDKEDEEPIVSARQWL